MPYFNQTFPSIELFSTKKSILQIHWLQKFNSKIIWVYNEAENCSLIVFKLRFLAQTAASRASTMKLYSYLEAVNFVQM